MTHISTKALLSDIKKTSPQHVESVDLSIKSILQKAREDIKLLTGIDVSVHAVVGTERIIPTESGVIKINITNIIIAACKAFDVAPKLLMTGTRKRHVADCRMAISHLCRVRYKINSLKAVALALGLSTHHAVMHHVEAVDDMLVTNALFEEQYYQAVDILEGRL